MLNNQRCDVRGTKCQESIVVDLESAQDASMSLLHVSWDPIGALLEDKNS
jgi:hypothetical protein